MHLHICKYTYIRIDIYVYIDRTLERTAGGLLTANGGQTAGEWQMDGGRTADGRRTADGIVPGTVPFCDRRQLANICVRACVRACMHACMDACKQVHACTTITRRVCGYSMY